MNTIKIIIEMVKDPKFWKFLMIIEIIGILIMLFVISPLVSTYDYNHNNYLSKNYKTLFGGAYYKDADKIVILDNSTITLRHELTHREQAKRNKTNVYLDEFEAYIEQYFIWKKVNLTTLDWEKDG